MLGEADAPNLAATTEGWIAGCGRKGGAPEARQRNTLGCPGRVSAVRAIPRNGECTARSRPSYARVRNQQQ